MRILLITGWGGGCQLLQPLQQSLSQQGYQVGLINIFNGLDPQVLAQHVEMAYQYDVIVGWSLGGQLATLLVNQIAQQYQQYKILITLASNPCFVAHTGWLNAMTARTFTHFTHSFQQDAVSTLKKFGYMVCQGVETSRQDFIKLQSLIQPQNIELLKQGLTCLEKLNNVDILNNYAGYQYHLFAKQDFLVSYKVSQNFSNLTAKFLEFELISGSHGFPIFAAQEISHKIYQYLKKISETEA